MKESNYLITRLVDIRASRNQRTAAQRKGGGGEGVRRSEVQRPLKYVKEHSASYGVMGSVEDSEKGQFWFELDFP